MDGVGELRGLVELVTPLHMLMLAVVLGGGPEVLLRIGLMMYPRHHDRRRELVAEMAVVPVWKRPIWGAQLFVVGLFEGTAARRDARQERHVEDSNITVLPQSDTVNPPAGGARGAGTAHEPTVRTVDGGSDQGPVVVEESRPAALLVGEGRLTVGVTSTATVTATALDAAPAEDRVGNVPVVIQPDPPWGFIRRRRDANVAALRSWRPRP